MTQTSASGHRRDQLRLPVVRICRRSVPAVLDSAGKIQKPKLPPVKMPQEWGQQLGGELLERFGRPIPVDVPPAAREGEIWEDWQWEADK